LIPPETECFDYINFADCGDFVGFLGGCDATALADFRTRSGFAHPCRRSEVVMRHILVVDDEPAICAVLQMTFEADGTSRVSTAACAEDAVAIAMRDRPDAAIIDAVLPRTSGLTLAKLLIGHGIPVLVMTGQPDYQRQLEESGICCLAKPISMRRVVLETRFLLDEATRRMAQLQTGLAELYRARSELSRLLEDGRVLIARVQADREARWTAEDRRRSPCKSIWESLLEEALAAAGTDRGILQIADRTTETLRIVAYRGLGEPFREFFTAVKANDDSASGAAFKRGCRIIAPDILRSTVFVGKASCKVLRDSDIRAVQATPVLGRDWRVSGVIETYWRSPWQPREAALAGLNRMAARVAEAIESLPPF
jgi:CheY-like chemotaxis protein